MGNIQKEIPVKLICGFIFSDKESFIKASAFLSRKFGKIDFESESLVFNFTGYYEKELGNDLKRKFISFERLIWPSKLCSIKIYTNKIESKFLINSNRKINIDPGYVDASKLVLATTKDYSHRIYLSKGIFAEVTLAIQDKCFVPCLWTYPDYRTDVYLKVFNQIRLIYLGQLKNKDNV